MAKKICLIIDSLSSGGAEKMAANMSLSLSQKGYLVHLVSMEDNIDYLYKGKLFNFGEIKQKNNRLIAFIKFRQFFKNEKFNVIIDHRVRNVFFKEFFFSKLVFYNCRVIYIVHHYILELYFPKIIHRSLLKFVLVKKNRVIAVSDNIKQKITKTLKLNSTVIYNYPLQKQKIENIKLNYKYIIAVGRLEKIKQFDVLIKSYKNSKLLNNEIKLIILGDGKEYNNLIKLILELKLEAYVELLGFKTNTEAYIKNAKALVLSSKAEGFPMVLIEALSLKVPVISYNCKSGPNEIIKNELNGLLVQNQNSEALTKAMDKLILDKLFYNNIKNYLNENKNPFSEEFIINHWVKLIEDFI